VQAKEALQQGKFQDKFKYYALEEGGLLKYKGSVYVPNRHELRSIMLREMHNVPYVGHLGYHKTIAVVIGQYFWLGMKKDVVDYIAKCMEFHKVKVEHRNTFGLSQPLAIPKWKWKVVTMDFITKLPKIVKQHDSIMVVVDKLTNEVRFVSVKMKHKEKNIADIYIT
jgi:hypothetical protein